MSWAAVSLALLAATQPVVRPFMRPVPPARSETPAWFNLRLPGPETDPVQGPLESPDTRLPARPAQFAPGPMDPALRGEAIHRDVATIVGFSHESRAAGDYLWGRVTGRPAYDETVAWASEALRRAGLADARLEPFRAAGVNLPVSGEIRLVGTEAMGAGSQDIVLKSAMVGGDGPVDGVVTAPLVYVGQGLDADLAGRDLKGKIAVVVATPDPSLYAAVPSNRLAAVMAAGAVGAIEILAQPGNLKSFDRDRHGCGRDLCFTVGGEDGFFLQTVLGEAAKAGKAITATLSATSETLDRDVSNAVATLPGKTDRTVIVVAHADGWFGGADDNASGLAVMVALARHFAAGPRLDRTLVFVASAGHHSAGANGVRAFRAHHDGDYVAKADLIVNIEHPAQSAMMRTYVERQDDNFGSAMTLASGDLPKQIAVNNRAPFLIDLWRQGIACFGLEGQRIVDQALPGDLNGFSDLKSTPQTQMIASGGVYHTTGDDLYSTPPEALERAARFHAYLIAAAANADGALLRGADVPARNSCPPTP
ncbi:M28 family peptidase [Caulobacter sp.]|uniref:M28 family peptidase n=1 Tax=Caulobacter sp. TaxID=78 RepID=UPI001B07ED4C|nr:M28 family peptidase [Caulobacter sp.]MBO9543813.1 M28 family peptidase [Caulobacter sp.]